MKYLGNWLALAWMKIGNSPMTTSLHSSPTLIPLRYIRHMALFWWRESGNAYIFIRLWKLRYQNIQEEININVDPETLKLCAIPLTNKESPQGEEEEEGCKDDHYLLPPSIVQYLKNQHSYWIVYHSNYHRELAVEMWFWDTVVSSGSLIVKCKTQSSRRQIWNVQHVM